MTDSTQAAKLHQRWALGEELTAKEQKILEAWYTDQDAKEAEALQIESDSDKLSQALKKQITEMLRQISESVKRIQQLTVENEQLKVENEELKRLLAQRLSQQRA